MTHQAKFHGEFWKTMGERFGKRWFDSSGPLPSKEWRELLNEFTREEIDEALLRLKDRPPQYRGNPPAYTEFQALLATAAKSRGPDPSNASRRYWRSVIVKTTVNHAVLLNIIPYGETGLGKLPPDVYRLVSDLCEKLLEETLCNEEREGQRTTDMSDNINKKLWHLLYDRVPRGTTFNGNQAGPAPSDAVADHSCAQGEFVE